MAHAPGELPTLAELAKSGGVSQSKMRRLFQMAHGCSVLSYVRKVRLEQARAGLENNLMTVAEAAYLAGYGSPENFSTAFRRQHGISPSEAIRRR
jgi:AraC-like DNA-binding protein